MRVTPGPHGLLVEVIRSHDSKLAQAIFKGAPFQLIFVNANPFGWFVLNAGKVGHSDCCWAMSAVDKEDITTTESCLRTMMAENPVDSWEPGLPAEMEVVDLRGAVYERRPLEMPKCNWHLLPKTYLRHPTMIDAKELAKQQKRLEHKYQTMRDFQQARVVWAQDYNPAVEQLGPQTLIH